MEARVTRLEEWSKLLDVRLGRIEDKLDVIAGQLVTFQADIRIGMAGMVSKADLDQARRHQTATLWAGLSATVGVLALLFTAYQALAPKATSVSATQPILIQLPTTAAQPALAPAPGQVGAGRSRGR